MPQQEIRLTFRHADFEIRDMFTMLEHISKDAGKSMAKAINAALLDMRMTCVKIARRTYTYGQMEKIEYHRATRNKPWGCLRLNAARTNLINFLPRPAGAAAFAGPRSGRPRQGVSVKTERKGARFVPVSRGFPNAKPFILKGSKTGKQYVMVSSYDKLTGETEYRSQHGPSPVEALFVHTHELQAEADDSFSRHLLREMNAALDRTGAR
ncbi:MAG: hypothetical protein LBD82_05260 [Deltaproteobacteria bacterium]|jgi:hypothetical protein|nr:hypothetical protein [Deltaproteobacteria bacterium]